MLYGQFPFYDSAPQELFNKIKTAEFTIPDDGRVSEDTKAVIKRLLVTEPDRRLTAQQVRLTPPPLLPWPQVRRAVEGIIVMWRSISPGGGAGAGLQEVPEWRPEQGRQEGKVQGTGLSHETVLLNLSQGREGAVEERKKGVEGVRSKRQGGIPVHRLGEDARPLTAEEYRLYSPVITEMRGGSRARRGTTTSSVAQVLVRQRPGTGPSSSPLQPQGAPPNLASLPATVPDQAEVLDLSSGPRRELQPPPRPVPPPLQPLPPSPARPEERALSLVGALRRLGTRVNLVPVSFGGQRRSGSGGPGGREERRRAGWPGERRREGERLRPARERQAAVIERLSEYRRGRSLAGGGRPEERSGLALVSRLGQELGPLPQGEGRLLAQGWEGSEVREADNFLRELEQGQVREGNLGEVQGSSSVGQGIGRAPAALQGPVLEGVAGQGPVLDEGAGQGLFMDDDAGQEPVLSDVAGERPVLADMAMPGSVLDEVTGQRPVMDEVAGQNRSGEQGANSGQRTEERD